MKREPEPRSQGRGCFETGFKKRQSCRIGKKKKENRCLFSPLLA